MQLSSIMEWDLTENPSGFSIVNRKPRGRTVEKEAWWAAGEFPGNFRGHIADRIKLKLI